MNSPMTIELLQEILKWQKLQGMKLLRELIPALLSDESKRTVYELTDGKNPQKVIARKAGVAGGTVSNWWNTWYSYGILTKDDNRYKKIIPLKELDTSIKNSSREARKNDGSSGTNL